MSGGADDISLSGAAIGTTVNSDGCEAVDFGGTASGTNVSSGGYLVVAPGGAQSGTTVQPGGAIVSTGVVVYQSNSGVTVYASSATDIVVGSFDGAGAPGMVSRPAWRHGHRRHGEPRGIQTRCRNS